MTTTAEYQERRKLLTAALRSGEYLQGRNQLRQHSDPELQDGQYLYCCLGVGCSVYAKETGLGGWNSLSFKEGRGSDTLRLIGPVQKWFGFNGNEGDYENPEYPQTLSYHNDSDQWTFSQIADLIDLEPEGMFVSE